MSTRAAVIVLHKKSCEIVEVQYGYDLAENWLSGSISPKQLDALRTRAKELSTIPLSDGELWEYYYELKFPTLSDWSKYLIFNLSHTTQPPRTLPTLQP